MKLRKSYVLRLFLALLAVFLVLLTVSSMGIYAFSRHAVGEEFIRLNRNSLSHIASSTGITLEELRDFGEKLSVNSRILYLSRRSDKFAHREVRNILVEQLSEFNATHLDGSALVEAYIITESGLELSAYNSGQFTWENVQKDPAFAPLLSGETDLLILPTKHREGVYGIMGHTFQIAVAMRDLLTGDPRGLVVLDISEIALYEKYHSYQDSAAQMQIITAEGRIISHGSKKYIGTNADFTLDLLDERDTVESQTSGDYFLIYAPIPQTQWLLVLQMPTEVAFGTLTRVRNVALLFAAGSSLAAVLLLLFPARQIALRVDRIRSKMEDVVAGDLSVRIPVGRDDEFGQIESAFNAMVEETNRLINQVRQSEQQRHIAQMDFLHAQINSHFIHNTLTSIRFMLEMDRVKEAGEMVYYFSRLLRQTLSRSTEFIPLEEELDTLRSYVMLQSHRYRDTFEADYDFDEALLQVPVPALILQPVVENAIFHGAREHFTHIHIRGFREDSCLILTVEDNGLGMPEQKVQAIFRKDASLNRVGVRNVHQRIQLIYGEEYGLSIQSRPGQGTTVRFTLPLYTEGGNPNEA